MSIEFLCHFDGTNGSTTFVDSSNNAFAITRAAPAQLSTTGQTFGTACGLFDSATSSITASLPAPYDISATDFTLAFRITFTAEAGYVYGGNKIIDFGCFSIRTLNGSAGKVVVDLYDSYDNVRMYLGELSVNTAYAVRIEGYAGFLRLYLSGINVDYPNEVSLLPSQSISTISVRHGDFKIDELLFDYGLAYAGGSASYIVEVEPFSVPEILIITSQPTMPPADIGQIYVIGVNELTLQPTLYTLGAIDTTSLTITPSLPSVNVPVVQTIGASALTATPSLTAASVGQIHAIVATPLTSQPTVTAAAVTMAHAINASELVSQPTVTAAAIGQIHIIAANPLNSTSTLSIYAPNSDSIGGVNHMAINFSVDNKSVTTFSNLNFTGSCQFNGKTLFINEQGLFEYGGLTDNGTAIVPSLKTGKMDVIQGQNGLIHTNKIKRIFTSKVRVSCDKIGGSLDLNVTADTNTYAYHQAVTHDGVATHNIPIGRGIKYNFIQLELTANGCGKLDIDSIDFEPTAIQRSER